MTPLAHFLLSLLYIQINAGSSGPQDPWSSVMALMPDPDIAGHHGDKNTQTDGRVHRQRGERQQQQQAQLKISEERRTAITAVC